MSVLPAIFGAHNLLLASLLWRGIGEEAADSEEGHHLLVDRGLPVSRVATHLAVCFSQMDVIGFRADGTRSQPWT